MTDREKALEGGLPELALEIVDAIKGSFSVGNFDNTVGSDWKFASEDEVLAVVLPMLNEFFLAEPPSASEPSVCRGCDGGCDSCRSAKPLPLTGPNEAPETNNAICHCGKPIMRWRGAWSHYQMGIECQDPKPSSEPSGEPAVDATRVINSRGQHDPSMEPERVLMVCPSFPHKINQCHSVRVEVPARPNEELGVHPLFYRMEKLSNKLCQTQAYILKAMSESGLAVVAAPPAQTSVEVEPER